MILYWIQILKQLTHLLLSLHIGLKCSWKRKVWGLMHQIMGAFGNITNIRWHCQWWNELFILGQLVEIAVTIVLCLLQRWLSHYRLFQTLTHPWFWYILSRETSPPPESMLYWATLLMCVSHPSDMLKWGKKYVFKSWPYNLDPRRTRT